MLIKCPECELQVSDKALSCPHCGYPMTETKPRLKRAKNKRRRLPNGFGQISEIKGRNLRKPFRAMVTVAKSETGKPICKPLKPESYFETYNDAYAALVEYNRNPYDLGDEGITVKELYEKWSVKHFENIDAKSAVPIETAWKFCAGIYGMKVRDVRIRHLKGCLEEGVAVLQGSEVKANPRMQARIKSLLNMMFDFAVEYELTDKNYARAFALSAETHKEIRATKKDHIAFTDEEMTILWNNADAKQYVDIIIVQCYSGWRPQEIGLIELKDVDFEKWTFTGGLKTDSGKNRTVPIHPKIRHIVKRHYERSVEMGSKYLFNAYTHTYAMKDSQLTYHRYTRAFKFLIEDLKLNPNHKPHDMRKHFVTMAKAAGVDEYAIKYIVGHTITDLTERVYTQRDVEWLCTEMEKIK
jgi:integrase